VTKHPKKQGSFGSFCDYTVQVRTSTTPPFFSTLDVEDITQAGNATGGEDGPVEEVSKLITWDGRKGKIAERQRKGLGALRHLWPARMFCVV